MRSESETLVQITRDLGIEVVQPSDCWFDGENCPYGLPAGKFENRPLSDCHLNTGGCRKLEFFKESDFLTHITDKTTSAEYKRIRNGLDERREPVSEFLENQAKVLLEENEINDLESKLVLTVSNIFKKLEDQFVVSMSEYDLDTL